MSAESSIHLYLSWAKERIDEMDAALTAFAIKITGLEADLRSKADKALTELEKKRDAFQHLVTAQAEAGETAWINTKATLEADWKDFETGVKKYIETFGKKIEQQQSAFALQSAAQLKAWHESANALADAAKDFKAERRDEIEAIVKRMKSDAEAAEKTFKKLAVAGNESWSALTAALDETRTAFDRANQAAREAFRRTTV
ncbi:MAG: hypothetical protein EKK40_13350 [Bradyrhizobiaceae bacterium]|nr:MAG: hypothetical protein EKK40_13350 [Bradyrhizobiaceae bacterium]